MTAIATGNVTYTGFDPKSSTYLGPKYGWLRRGTISFGNGSLTYPSGGIPLTKSKLGCPHSLVDVIFIEASTNPGNRYEFDRSAGKIRIFENAPSGTITSTFTGDKPTFTGDKPTFTGDAPRAISEYVVVDDNSPSGKALYVMMNPAGAILCSNADVAQADTIISIGNDMFCIDHVADPANALGASPLYLIKDIANTNVQNRILSVTAGNANIFVQGSNGGLLKIVDNDNAATLGDAIIYDDNSDHRLECTTTGNANANIGSLINSWIYTTPTGNVSTVTGNVATVTGNVTSTFSGTDAQGPELDTGDTPAATVLEVEVIGW